MHGLLKLGGKDKGEIQIEKAEKGFVVKDT